MKIGEKIKKAIQKEGRTSKWVAEKMGLSQSQLSQRINGKIQISYNEVEDIKKILGIEIL